MFDFILAFFVDEVNSKVGILLSKLQICYDAQIIKLHVLW